MEHSADPVTVEKHRIRERVRAGRGSLTPDDRAAATAALTTHLIDLVRAHSATSISCYLSMPTEPGTSGLLEWADAAGIDVLLPTSLPGHRLGWIVPDGHGTTIGAHGIREPLGETLPETAVANVDLMLIPASAVDLRGIRMGWGLGYYDRCLAELTHRPPVFAVLFDDEVFDRVPAEPHDVPISGVVTPSGIRRFGPRAID